MSHLRLKMIYDNASLLLQGLQLSISTSALEQTRTKAWEHRSAKIHCRLHLLLPVEKLPLLLLILLLVDERAATVDTTKWVCLNVTIRPVWGTPIRTMTIRELCEVLMTVISAPWKLVWYTLIKTSTGLGSKIMFT